MTRYGRGVFDGGGSDDSGSDDNGGGGSPRGIPVGGAGGGGDDEPDGPGGGVDLGGIGGGGDDSEPRDTSGGAGRGPSDDSDPAPAPPDPDPPADSGGEDGGTGGSNPGDSAGSGGSNGAIDPSETQAAGVVGDPGGEIDPSDTPAAGTVGGDGGGVDPSETPAAGTVEDAAVDPSDTPAATEFEDPIQGAETNDGRVGEQAAAFEQGILDDRDLTAEDVRVTRDGDRLRAELTGTGQTELRTRAVEDARDEIQQQRTLARRRQARDADPTPDGLEGGDVRLFAEERQLRREQEEFGDIEIDSPVSDNRLEEDLETGAEQFRDLVAGLGATTSTVGAPVAATGQVPRPGQAERADLKGLDSQVFDSAADALNPFGIAAGGKEIAEFAATQPQRVADPDRRGEFVDDVEQRAGRIAASTAERASDSPAEFAVGTALGLGFGAIGGGAAGSATRRLSGGRVDLGSDLSGRVLERTAAGARRFRDANRGQADLSGFGRGDDDSSSGGGLSDDLDEALSNFEESGGTDLPDDPAGMSFRPELDREADVDPTGRVQQQRDRAQRDGPGETTTGSLGLDERPTRDAATREDPLPDRARDRSGRDRETTETVDDALGRRQDAQQRFDARASGLGAGASGLGSLFGVGSNAATGTNVGAAFGTPGVETGSGVGTGTFGDGSVFGDADIFGDVDIRGDIDTRSDVDTRTDLDTRTDTDTRIDTRTDTTIRTDTRMDTRTDTGFDSRFDSRFDAEFGDEDQDDEPPLFGTASEARTVDSGLQSGADAAEELFGDDPFKL